MARIEWLTAGEKFYEAGCDRGVLYPAVKGTYPKGTPWNGLISVTESPSGAESNPQYADNVKYLDLQSAEDFGATIEAFTYPKEFAACDGTAELTTGVYVGQQRRQPFGMAYRTKVGNDTDGQDHAYKIHLVYGAQASPSEKAFTTINDSPEALTFSWEITTTPVAIKGTGADGKEFRPCASLVVDSREVEASKLKKLEDALYGDASNEARLPLPDEVKTILGI